MRTPWAPTFQRCLELVSLREHAILPIYPLWFALRVGWWIWGTPIDDPSS